MYSSRSKVPAQITAVRCRAMSGKHWHVPTQDTLSDLMVFHSSAQGAHRAHDSSSRGRKVTDAVIWRMMAWISDTISASGFSTAFLHNRAKTGHRNRPEPQRASSERSLTSHSRLMQQDFCVIASDCGSSPWATQPRRMMWLGEGKVGGSGTLAGSGA